VAFIPRKRGLVRFGQHVAEAVRRGVEEDAMRTAVERLDLDVGTGGRRAVDLLKGGIDVLDLEEAAL
jgi:hypothetical protein